MDIVLLIVFFAALAVILAYTIMTHFTVTRPINWAIFLIAIGASLPILGLALYALFSSSYDDTTRMWAMGICGVIGGFWLKNPFRDVKLL